MNKVKRPLKEGQAVFWSAIWAKLYNRQRELKLIRKSKKKGGNVPEMGEDVWVWGGGRKMLCRRAQEDTEN